MNPYMSKQIRTCGPESSKWKEEIYGNPPHPVLNKTAVLFDRATEKRGQFAPGTQGLGALIIKDF